MSKGNFIVETSPEHRSELEKWAKTRGGEVHPWDLALGDYG